MTARKPRPYRVLLLLPVTAYVSLLAGMGGMPPTMGQTRKPNFDAVPLPAGAVELKLDFRFPEAEGPGPFLSMPQGLGLAPSGHIYISDPMANEVHAFDSDGGHLMTFGRTGQGPGDFLRPTDIAFTGRHIIVRDSGNRRIQIFDPAGKYLSGFKVFRSYQGLAAAGDRIYAVALAPDQARDPGSGGLIDVLDLTGRRLGTFGTFLDAALKQAVWVLHTATLTVGSDSDLWLAFNFYPVVRKYTTEGRLVSEFRYRNPITDETEAFNSKSLKNGAEWLAGVAQAAYAAENGLYLIVNMGHRILISFMRSDGQISASYWAPREGDGYWCRGLIVREDKNGRRFYILNGREACIEVYSVRR